MRHEEDARAEFVRHFSRQGVSDAVSLEVYDYFRQMREGADAVVRPEHDLYGVYRIWNEDLDDAVLELARKCGLKRPTTEAVKDLPPVRRVEDLVRLLAHLSRR